jgi:hypothetical protein
MNHWIFKAPSGLQRTIESVEDLPNYKDAIGFVYMITNTINGKFYIGRKNLYSEKKTRISKKEKSQSGTRKTFKQVVKESNWKTYNGSCKELLDDIESIGEKFFRREIIEVCCTKKYLGYCELEYQIKYNVLTGNSYNGNILGKYFPKDMLNCKS